MKKIPVFMISGILDSGKTKFIIDTFKSEEVLYSKTLIIACEDGENEYDSQFLKDYKSVIEFVEDEEDFTLEYIQKLIIKHDPARIIIEMNGMWDLSKVEFPIVMQLAQHIYLINYETFPIYFNNMRQKFLDYVKQADAVVFNRVPEDVSLESYASSFRLSNSNCQYVIEQPDGSFKEAFEIVLPYDVNSDIIKVNDDDFGIWYIDTFDHPDKYEGKQIDIKVMVVKSKKLPKHAFMAARKCMNCCSDDIQLFGHLCLNPNKIELKDRSWVRIVASMEYVYNQKYQEDELVLTPSIIEEVEAPAEEVLDLTK